MVSASTLVLGTAQWGMPYGIANSSGPPDLGEVRRMVACAVEAGVRTIDTARAYGNAEPTIGRTLASFPGGLDMELVTKLSPDVVGNDVDAERAKGRTRASIRQSLEALRRRKLDVLLLHRAAHRTVLGGVVWGELRRARDEGVVGAIGASALSPDEAETLLADPDVDALQVAASVFDQRLFDAGFFARARRRGLRVFVRSVFLQGVLHLEHAALPPHLARLAPTSAKLANAAATLGMGVGAAALLFARDSFDAELVVGCERLAQLEANLIIIDGPHLSPEALGLLRRCRPPADPDLLDPWRWPPPAVGGAGPNGTRG